MCTTYVSIKKLSLIIMMSCGSLIFMFTVSSRSPFRYLINLLLSGARESIYLAGT